MATERDDQPKQATPTPKPRPLQEVEEVTESESAEEAAARKKTHLAKKAADSPIPAKPQTPKPEPVKPQSVKPEPVRAQPVKPEPVKPQAVKPEPLKPQPVKPEPNKPQTKPEPAKSQSPKPEPESLEAVKTEPLKKLGTTTQIGKKAGPSAPERAEPDKPSPVETVVLKKKQDPAQTGKKLGQVQSTQLAGDVPEMSVGESDDKGTDIEHPAASDVLDDDHSADALIGEELEPRPETGDSSFLEAMVIDSGVDLKSADSGVDVMESGYKSKPSSGIESADDLFSVKPEDKGPSASSSNIFGKEFSGKMKGSGQGVESLARKEEALEEILEAVDKSAARRDRPDFDSEIVDLGQSPEGEGSESGPSGTGPNVLDSGELAPGSSALDWEQIAEETPPRPLKRETLEQTVAYIGPGEKPSHVAPSDSAIEFGKTIDTDSHKKKGDPTDIADLDALLTEEDAGAPKGAFGEATEVMPPDEDAATYVEDKPRRKKAKDPSVVFDGSGLHEPPSKLAAADRVAEDDDFVSKKGDKKVAPVQPKRGGVLVGAAAGILVALIGGAGVWFLAPQLLTGLSKASPNYKAEPARTIPQPQVAIAQQARELMHEGKFKEALDLIKDADASVPGNLATRGEARWWKYAKEQLDAKAPFDRESPEVKLALADLTAAKADVIVVEINSVLDQAKLHEAVKGNEKTLTELRDALVKAKVADKLEPKDVPTAVTQALASKQKSDELIAGIAESLAKDKLIADPEKFDLSVFHKALKQLGEIQEMYAATNKLLQDAKVKDAGPKGVETVLKSRIDLEEKLDAVNKILTDEKVTDPGAKGLQALLETRNRLAKDRDELDQAIRTAYKELEDAKLVPPGADPRAKMLEGVKLARSKADSPLSVSLSQLASSLGQAGAGTAGLLQQGLNHGAVLTQRSINRLSEPLNKLLTGGAQPSDGASQPNPFLAEHFFGKGLHYYWDKQYAKAEGEFQKALKHFSQDARYQYFLGLSQWAQDTDAKRAASAFAFEQAARLEAANRPGIVVVNGTIERLQGDLRRIVDGYRQKALTSAN
ncbi:MAG: hypothetical protein HY040_13350 [Planctomycetes bacterium]|nr:hypothetical protein [Planctomycetota bacterium]